MSSVPSTTKITGAMVSPATVTTGAEPPRGVEVFSITREGEFSIAKEGGSISILLEGDMEGVV